MPDLIPEYDAVAEYFESGDLGEWHDDAGNATYERVEDVLQRADFGSQPVCFLIKTLLVL